MPGEERDSFSVDFASLRTALADVQGQTEQVEQKVGTIFQRAKNADVDIADLGLKLGRIEHRLKHMAVSFAAEGIMSALNVQPEQGTAAGTLFPALENGINVGLRAGPEAGAIVFALTLITKLSEAQKSYEAEMEKFRQFFVKQDQKTDQIAAQLRVEAEIERQETQNQLEAIERKISERYEKLKYEAWQLSGAED